MEENWKEIFSEWCSTAFTDKSSLKGFGLSMKITVNLKMCFEFREQHQVTIHFKSRLINQLD